MNFLRFFSSKKTQGPHHSVFYCTGFNGRLRVGLGEALTAFGVHFTGIEYRGDFLTLSLNERLELFSEKLQLFESRGGRKLIAVSAGGGLALLHLLQNQHPNLDVLLLSPVIKKVHLQLPHSGGVICNHLRLVTGTEDKVCSIEQAQDFVSLHQNISFKPIQGAGHNLPHHEVRSELESFLRNNL